jgi:hypothetical protein
MHGLLRLGPSGPFRESSQPAWFFSGQGAVRILSNGEYRSALIEDGIAPHVAADLVGRMTEFGSDSTLWARAHGGRRGHFHVMWDVRVSTTGPPASDAVPRVIGGVHTPLGAAPIGALEGAADVLVAYRARIEPTTIKLPPSHGPRWSAALRLASQIRNHATQCAYAVVTAGHVGATILVFAEGPGPAEHALRSLVDVVRADIAS